MSDGYDVFEKPKPAPKAKVQPKPEPEPEVKDEAEEAPPEGMTREEVEKLRRDIFRMWHPEPEETR